MVKILAAIDHWVWVIVCPIISYFIGSIPFSYIIAKWRTGDDIRELGNKNVGGLNVMINTGFNWGILAGGLDFLKGLVCVIAALVIPFNDTPIGGTGEYWEISIHNLIFIFVTMAVVLGHNYPIYLRFQGGRGMAAIVSFLVIVNPLLLLVFIFSLVIFVLITKHVRASTFLALFIGVPVAFFLNLFPPWIILVGMDSTFVLGLFTIGIAVAIFPKFLTSFLDIFKGKEYRVGKTGVVLPDEKQAENEL
ncbi:MAG: glycerol-3-phosphate acyltransferase [Candidatus Heimdallarchaeota archaeon]|nr:glycerol-3-phosphate acyltransferase [Candidatus Heimdallarchaeota archaeon]MCK4290735.1 glycerol-3-phosphate acyltransferase [Candidatus Heimdallarchaeota archaeon]